MMIIVFENRNKRPMQVVQRHRMSNTGSCYITLIHTHSASHIAKWHTVYSKTAHRQTATRVPGTRGITCAHHNTEMGGSYPPGALCENRMPSLKCVPYTRLKCKQCDSRTVGHVPP